jgi:hypothetical protein
MVGQEGMPPPAARPRGPKLKFTPEDDQLLVDLKEKKNLTWKQIAEFFPGRSSGTLQVRYCTKLKAKATVWTDEMVSTQCFAFIPMSGSHPNMDARVALASCSGCHARCFVARRSLFLPHVLALMQQFQVVKLRNAMREYENDRWRIISTKVGSGFSPAACKEKAAEMAQQGDVVAEVEEEEEEEVEEDLIEQNPSEPPGSVLSEDPHAAHLYR